MKALKAIQYTFLLIGAAMLVGAGVLYVNTWSFLADAVRTEGTVIAFDAVRSRGSTTYRPIVRFNGPNGAVEFASPVSSNPPVYKTNEAVTVLYQSAAPNDARIESFFQLWFGVVIAGGLGTVFSSIGGVMFLLRARRARIKQYLLSNGMPIQTEFQSVQINRSVSVNGRSPFCVMTQWLDPATHRIHVFKSEDIWFDPTHYITRRHITVLIDNANLKHYHVDLSFLPEAADGSD